MTNQVLLQNRPS